MHRKKNGPTLAERIEERLATAKKLGLTENLDEFFQETNYDGLPFYLRRTSTLDRAVAVAPAHDPADNIVLEEPQEEAEPEEEVPRVKYDAEKGVMHYEDFLQFYEDEIEGRAPRRVGGVSFRPVTGQSQRQSVKTPKGETPEETPRVDEEEQKEEGEGSGGEEGEEAAQSKQPDIGDLAILYQERRAAFHYECNIKVLPESVVSDLGDSYVLAVHPQPLVENQLFVFQVHESDRPEEKPAEEKAEGEEEVQDSEINFRDYSLMPRLAKPPLAAEKLQ